MAEIHDCTKCEIGSNCFQNLFPQELEFINTKKTQITYLKGENLCKQGAYASYVLYITNGLVKVYLENSNKKVTNIQILKTSDFIGLSSIFGDNINHYSAIALKDSEICLIEKDGIKELLDKNGTFASSIIKTYCDNEKELFEKIKSIGYKQMNGRLADALLYLSSDRLKDDDVFNYLNRKDIADFACISKESTVKLLSDFNSDKIIKMTGKQIKILDYDSLKSISLRG